MALGWRILKDGEYRIDLPRLSEEEEAILAAMGGRLRDAAHEDGALTKGRGMDMLRGTLHAHAQESGMYIGAEQGEYLSRIAWMHFYGYGFMEQLLADRNIEEISVIGLGMPAYVYLRGGGWRSVNACFTDEKALADVVNKMARGIGRHITVQNPRLDAMLPDGSRLHASLPPISQGEITIRRFRERPFSPGELAENGTLSAEALAYLSLLMQGDHSVIIAGNTASGKTTTLNALFSFVPCNERVLIAEETPEISIPHAHQLRLVANREMGVSLRDLVYDSLRMRPDRMIVGEIRNREEAEALFDVLLAGQARGSYATLHAQSAEEAVQRLLTFGISRMDVGSVDCVVVQRRMLAYDLKARRNTEVRRVVEIVEMANGIGTTASAPCGPKAAFRLDHRKGRLVRCPGASLLLPQVARAFGCGMGGIEREMASRERLFMRLGGGFAGFYRGVQKALYGLDASGVCGDEGR